MKHLRRSAGFGRARLNTSLAIRSGSQTSGQCGGTIGVAENYVTVPFLLFGTSRGGSTGPSPPRLGPFL
jgi:hypothetical protein